MLRFIVVHRNINTTALNVIAKSNLSTIQTRDVVESPSFYDYMPKARGMKEEMSFDLSPLITRPFNYRYDTWNTTANRHSVIVSHELLRNFFASNPGIANTMQSYSFFRAHACVYVSLTGTISHQGILLVGVLPGTAGSVYASGAGSKSELINTILSSPHAFLGANEATSACIEIPFYVPTDFLTLDSSSAVGDVVEDLALPDFNSYATLVMLVMNPLSVAEGASTSISIHTQIEMKKLEVYVPSTPNAGFAPTPPLVAQSYAGQVVTSLLDTTASVAKSVSSDFIDSLRTTVRSVTGLHNPNRPALRGAHLMQTRNRMNVVDDETQYEKLDPYTKFSRITKDGIFHTVHDEMNIGLILSKPQYIGSFQVSGTTSEATLLKSGPIWPMQFNAFGNLCLTSNIERLYYSTYAWSGDMELIIQSSMTNKHSVKISVAKCYGLNRKILTSVPTYSTSKVYPNSLLEFSAGNQQQVVPLDFLSRNQVLQNTMDVAAAALQHGMYYIYLVQPLVYAENVPQTVEFNMYLRCKDNFRFHGHSNRSGLTVRSPRRFVPTQVTVAEGFAPVAPVLDLQGQSAEACDPVMNAPNVCCPMAESPQEQGDEPDIERIRPVTHLRDLIRRPLLSYYAIYNPGTTGVVTFSIPVSALLGFSFSQLSQTVNHTLFRMYYGYNGGVKLKIKTDAANAVVRYCPPTYVYTGTTGYLRQSVYRHPGTILQNASDDAFVDSRLSIELPHHTSPDITAGKTYGLYDVHVPHHSIFNFVGGTDFYDETNNLNGYNTKMGAMGFLTISGRCSTETGTRVRFWIFAGADDEGRLGFHTMAPLLAFPLVNNTDKLLYSYDAVAKGSTIDFISLSTPTSLNYTNLPTPYETTPT